ncbi:hypothetical protein KO516_20730 [Citreicella sp. C3M06]|uniref:MBL fold metallo-hydrolase RNA specificity domain-containing protein n=1 Tax=Citreicella sp. C3M06 TaxID=2841564 RepID=UPI001C09BD04|nr:MBL fold metallo-hydrolase RNA specificity domain-containing protein [Citreicella sp. C3M06]MBU2963204.1 hypothetical protein [Citreicella sp. C3M06]
MQQHQNVLASLNKTATHAALPSPLFGFARRRTGATPLRSLPGKDARIIPVCDRGDVPLTCARKVAAKTDTNPRVTAHEALCRPCRGRPRFAPLSLASALRRKSHRADVLSGTGRPECRDGRSAGPGLERMACITPNTPASGPAHPDTRERVRRAVPHPSYRLTEADPDFAAGIVEAIRKIHGRGGNAIIASFALERTQEILFVLSEAVRHEELPRNLAVFLDSPMAISATEIFGRYPDAFQPQFRDTMAARDPFGLEGLRFTRGADESMAINQIPSGAVIIAGSGMCTGGRVVHHLKRNLWREDCGIILVGYAAEGTLARRLVDGAQSVKIYGQTVAVKAEIFTINGFSAHADQAELLAWHAHTGRPKQTFIVHGDPDRGMSHLQKALEAKGLATSCPKMHKSIHLD